MLLFREASTLNPKPCIDCNRALILSVQSASSMWLELGPQMLVASAKEGLISSMQVLVLGRIQGDPILHSALTTSKLFRLPTFAWSKWVSASGALGCGGFVFKICGPANVALSPGIFPRGWFCLGYISCMFCSRLCPVKLRCVHLPMANRFAKLDLTLLWLHGIPFVYQASRNPAEDSRHR